MALHNPYQALFRERILAFGGAGMGKAQPLDTPVLTSAGWRRMGDIMPGDFVVGCDGTSVEVTAIHPQGEVDIYRVTTSNGASTECCGDHLWTYRDDKNYTHTVSTAEIADVLLEGGHKAQRMYLPVVAPVLFDGDDVLPFDPYLLGLILGDGSTRSSGGIKFTSADQELHDYVEAQLPNDMHPVRCAPLTVAYRMDHPRGRGTQNPWAQIMRDLDLHGKRSEDKFVPSLYKWSSIENRSAILAGLLDTDGGMEGGKVWFTTTSEQLADDMLFLVRSLGGVAHLSTKIPTCVYKGERRTGKTAYRLNITLPSSHGSPFRLGRKTQQWEQYHAEAVCKEPGQRIVEVTYVGRKDAQCITVDATDGLYVTENFIVTHNSYGFYTIARLAKRTGSDARFFVIDTDESCGRMLSDPDMRDHLLDANGVPTNVTSMQVHDWKSMTTAIDTFQKIMRPTDWMLIDMISPTWDWVQAYYTAEVFSKGFEEYLMEHRKEIQRTGKDGGGAFDGWKDWGMINDLYESFQNKLRRSPGNLYCTAEVRAFSSSTASKEDKIMFGPHGVKPVGQKRTPHLFSTILLHHAARADEFLLTTVKDRSRQRLNGTTVNDYAVDYLVRVGGWKLADPAPVEQAAA